MDNLIVVPHSNSIKMIKKIRPCKHVFFNPKNNKRLNGMNFFM